MQEAQRTLNVDTMSKTRSEHISDLVLFERLAGEKHGAERAFAELYSRHSGKVWALCIRFLGDENDALDVFQDTFTRFFQAAKTVKDMQNVSGYLLKSARNLCLNARRDKRQLVELEDFHLAVPSPSLEESELARLITMALDVIPDEFREVFILREYEGLSYSEIADIVGTSLANVKIRIHRAKQKIRDVLSPYLAEFSENEQQ